MNNLVNRTSFFTLSIATTAFLLASNVANAEIYKWRNDRGVTQYSDKPPVDGFTKANRHELVNALQAKDLCVEPTAKTAAAINATPKINANLSFGGLGLTGVAAPAKTAAATGLSGLLGVKAAASASKTVVSSAKTIATSAKTVTTSAKTVTTSAKTVAVAAAPTSAALKPAAVVKSGSSLVSVFGSAAKPKVVSAGLGGLLAVKPAAVATKPVVAAPVVVAPVVAAPVVAAPVVAAPVVAAPVAAAPVTATPTTSTSSNLIQVAQMPAVDINKNIAAVVGFNEMRTRAAAANDLPRLGDSNGTIGAFRITCKPSHMSNDDPLVYPNQQGAAHHHTFFGNTTINYKTNLNVLSTTGTSTCNGGIANRSAYWVPSMIDTKTNMPMVPIGSLWYYKTGYYGVPTSQIKPPPKGLRFITGNMKATSETNSSGYYICRNTAGLDLTKVSKNIPACAQGNVVNSEVDFKQCWDGKNLDSPDHQSHMAEVVGGACPASHPVAIPRITLNVTYQVTDASGTANWRLSSDNYAKSGNNSGYSSHADFVNGWDETVITGIVKNCINAGKDCHAHLLGDGKEIY